MRGENRDGTLDWRVIGDGDSAQLGPARWSWSRTDHPVETLGGPGSKWAAERSATRLTPGPAWELSSLGEGVQLALVEATLTLEAEGSCST